MVVVLAYSMYKDNKKIEMIRLKESEYLFSSYYGNDKNENNNKSDKQ